MVGRGRPPRAHRIRLQIPPQSCLPKCPRVTLVEKMVPNVLWAGKKVTTPRQPPYELGGTSRVVETRGGALVGDYQQASCYDEEACWMDVEH
jgi:hypothetical protein